MKRWILFLMLGVAPNVLAQGAHLKASEAKDHIGETQTVCGKVVSARYASRSKGQPTFLNLDQPYRNEVFTILIWGDNSARFGTPESKYKDEEICVTGKISSYRAVPEVIATEPSQISEQK